MSSALIGLVSVGAFIGVATALVALAKRRVTPVSTNREHTPAGEIPQWLAILGSASLMAGPWWMEGIHAWHLVNTAHGEGGQR